MNSPKLSVPEAETLLSTNSNVISGNTIDLVGNYVNDGLPSNFAETLKATMDYEFAMPLPLNGYMPLREIVANKVSKLYGRKFSAESEITITNGTNQPLFASMSAMLKEGDEVMLFEPANEDYLPLILLSGARPVYITLKGDDFHIDWDEVTRMITSNTRMIIVNSPHNPTGTLLTELDMLRLQKVINGTRIVVLSDERYEDLIFDGQSHQSVMSYPKLAEKSIVFNSFSITCSSAAQIGYCIAPKALMTSIRGVLNILDGSVFTPFQIALAKCINLGGVKNENALVYSKKRDLLQDLMTVRTRFKPLLTGGTFFQLYSYADISDKKDRDFVGHILKETGVAVAPYSKYFHDKQKLQLIRINFARPDDVLIEAVERLSLL